MIYIELITFILDITGLFFISWNLFSVPKEIKTQFPDGNENGPLRGGTLRNIAQVVNSIIRDLNLIRKMRWGFALLLLSLILKFLVFIFENFHLLIH